MKNYFDVMDKRLLNILQIKKQYHDEACILMIIYLDKLSHYVSNAIKGDYRGHRIKLINFLRENSSMGNYFDFILMNKVYYMKEYGKKEIYRIACNKIYEEYKDKFEEFEYKVKKYGELAITESLTKNDILKINNIKDGFSNKKFDEFEIFLRKVSFGDLFYDYRCCCVHEHLNKFQSDFLDKPYYNYINDYISFKISFEIPFEFLLKLLFECYSKVKSEFNENMNCLCWDNNNDSEKADKLTT